MVARNISTFCFEFRACVLICVCRVSFFFVYLLLLLSTIREKVSCCCCFLCTKHALWHSFCIIWYSQISTETNESTQVLSNNSNILLQWIKKMKKKKKRFKYTTCTRAYQKMFRFSFWQLNVNNCEWKNSCERIHISSSKWNESSRCAAVTFFS